MCIEPYVDIEPGDWPHGVVDWQPGVSYGPPTHLFATAEEVDAALQDILHALAPDLAGESNDL